VPFAPPPGGTVELASAIRLARDKNYGLGLRTMEKAGFTRGPAGVGSRGKRGAGRGVYVDLLVRCVNGLPARCGTLPHLRPGLSEDRNKPGPGSTAPFLPCKVADNPSRRPLRRKRGTLSAN